MTLMEVLGPQFYCLNKNLYKVSDDKKTVEKKKNKGNRTLKEKSSVQKNSSREVNYRKQKKLRGKTDQEIQSKSSEASDERTLVCLLSFSFIVLFAQFLFAPV